MRNRNWYVALVWNRYRGAFARVYYRKAEFMRSLYKTHRIVEYRRYRGSWEAVAAAWIYNH